MAFPASYKEGFIPIQPGGNGIICLFSPVAIGNSLFSPMANKIKPLFSPVATVGIPQSARGKQDFDGKTSKQPVANGGARGK